MTLGSSGDPRLVCALQLFIEAVCMWSSGLARQCQHSPALEQVGR